MLTLTPIAVTGCPEPTAAFSRLATLYGLTLLDDRTIGPQQASGAQDGLFVHMAELPETATIDAALHPPYSGLIQGGPEVISDSLLTVLRATLDAKGLFLSLTTGRAYGRDLAPLFLAGVTAWKGATPQRAKVIELAVHEALSNALLHGNLEVDNALRDSLDGLSDYARQVSTRLADPVYAGRRLTLSAVWSDDELTITIGDSGPGYPPGAIPAHSDKTGRGLALIADAARSVDFADDGRTVILRFER